MAFDITTACNAVQIALTDLAGMETAMPRTRLGTLDALMNSVNMEGFRIEQLKSKQGHTPKVDIFFIPEGDPALVENTQIVVCDIVNEPEPIVADFAVEEYSGYGALMNLDNFEDFCLKGPQEFREWMTRSLVNPLLQNIDQTVLAKLLTKKGDYYNSTNATRTYNLLTADANAAANFSEFDKFIQDYTDFDGKGLPIIVGDKDIATYFKMVGIGCCNDNGVDMSKAGDAYFFRDKYASTILGSNDWLAWSPGAVQFVPYIKNQGNFFYIKQNKARITWVDAVTGIEFDLNIVEKECGDVIQFSLGLHYDVFTMPLTMYPAGPMAGVNFLVEGHTARV